MERFLMIIISNGSVFFRRALAFIIDLVISCLISFAFVVIGYLLVIENISWIAVIIVIVQIVCRDAFGRSPGKKIMQLTVICNHTKKKAPLFHRIVRNITCPLWMVEAIVCLITRGLRITDLWLGTKVVSDTEVL